MGGQADEPNLGVLLFIAYRALEMRVFQALAAGGFDDLTIAQARVFQRINREGSRLTELAEAAQMTKQATGFLVDQLERAGYVERVTDPSDRRARLIRVTARGEQTIQLSAAVIATVDAEWTEHLGRADIEHLRRTLSRLRDITDPYR